jgi:hypothetical protein
LGLDLPSPRSSNFQTSPLPIAPLFMAG